MFLEKDQMGGTSLGYRCSQKGTPSLPPKNHLSGGDFIVWAHHLEEGTEALEDPGWVWGRRGSS